MHRLRLQEITLLHDMEKAVEDKERRITWEAFHPSMSLMEMDWEKHQQYQQVYHEEDHEEDHRQGDAVVEAKRQQEEHGAAEGWGKMRSTTLGRRRKRISVLITLN